MDKIENASLTLKANVYFDGKVVSHTVHTPDGTKKTVGLIYPGAYKFDTGQPERMEIVAGSCRVKLAGGDDFQPYGAGTHFDVRGKSSFEIAVESGIAEYVCSFLPA